MPETTETSQRAKQLSKNYNSLSTRVAEISKTHNRDASEILILPVIDSQSDEDVLALYTNNNVRNFAVQDERQLIEKSKTLPQDIQWHLTGPLKGNKVKDVAQKVKNLKSVTISHRERIDNFDYARPQDWDPVDFYFQVITLGKQEGINFHDELRDFIVTSIKVIQVYCRKIKFKGFVTDEKPTSNAIAKLVELRKYLEEDEALPREKDMQLVVGTDKEYSEAIKYDAKQIRVSIDIFGK